MRVDMQRVKRLEYIELHRKLVIAYGYEEKDGLSLQYDPILLENTECIDDLPVETIDHCNWLSVSDGIDSDFYPPLPICIFSFSTVDIYSL